MTKAKDLRSMSKNDLNSKLVELKKELIKHNAQIATGTTPKSPGQVREVKKTIAKILTIVGANAPKLEDQKSSSVGAKEAPSTKKESKATEKPSDTEKAEENSTAPAKKPEEE